MSILCFISFFFIMCWYTWYEVYIPSKRIRFQRNILRIREELFRDHQDSGDSFSNARYCHISDIIDLCLLKADKFSISGFMLWIFYGYPRTVNEEFSTENMILTEELAESLQQSKLEPHLKKALLGAISELIFYSVSTSLTSRILLTISYRLHLLYQRLIKGKFEEAGGKVNALLFLVKLVFSKILPDNNWSPHSSGLYPKV